jgi:hypothetical protein
VAKVAWYRRNERSRERFDKNCDAPANLMNVFPGDDIDAVSGSERERAIAE